MRPTGPVGNGSIISIRDTKYTARSSVGNESSRLCGGWMDGRTNDIAIKPRTIWYIKGKKNKNILEAVLGVKLARK